MDTSQSPDRFADRRSRLNPDNPKIRFHSEPPFWIAYLRRHNHERKIGYLDGNAIVKQQPKRRH